MPILKGSKKAMRQNLKNRQRNYRVRRNLHDAIRELTDLVAAGDKTGAQKSLSSAYKVIDTAVKKNIIHQNNGNRKKSALAKQVDTCGAKKAAATKAPKKTTKVKKEKVEAVVEKAVEKEEVK